jgi:hypothetical protein
MSTDLTTGVGIATIAVLFAIAWWVDRASESRRPRNPTQELWAELRRNPWWDRFTRTWPK